MVGHGRYEFKNRFFVFEGRHEYGVRREGKLMFRDGGYYEGYFDGRGAISGAGYRRWSNGDTYSGQFLFGERHGLGTMIYANESRYEGPWALNARQGENGTLTMAEGHFYKGTFHADLFHGDGVMQCADGNRFEGQWKEGRRHGKGRLVYTDGGIFEGEWTHDVPGTGIYVHPVSKACHRGSWCATDQPPSDFQQHAQHIQRPLATVAGGAMGIFLAIESVGVSSCNDRHLEFSACHTQEANLPVSAAAMTVLEGPTAKVSTLD